MLLGDLAPWSVLALPFTSASCGTKIPGHESTPTDCGVWCRARYVVRWSMEIYQSRAFQHFLCFYRVWIRPKGYMRLTLISWCRCLLSDLWAKSLLHMVLLWLLSLSLVLLKEKNKIPCYCFAGFLFVKKKNLSECWFRYSKNLEICLHFVCLWRAGVSGVQLGLGSAPSGV